MSGRLLLLLFLLAALTTAATFMHKAQETETLAEVGLRDLERRSSVHGWPWGYYAEVMEVVQLGDHRVAVIEYNELRFEQLVQTFLVWFVGWLILVPILLLTAGPRPARTDAARAKREE